MNESHISDDHGGPSGGHRLAKPFFALILLGVLLGFAELVFRLAGFHPALPLDRDKPGIHAYFWICDRNLGFRNRANGDYVYDLMAAAPTVTTDRHGFRNGAGWDPDTGRPIVLFVGDSIVFCAEVEDDQTIASETARSLDRMRRVRTADRGAPADACPDVCILNAGVRGYSTVQSKRMMEECLGRYTNIVAVVYAYCGNDFHENIVSDCYAPARAPTAQVDADSGALIEIDVTDPAVPWGESFMALADERYRKRLAVLRNKRWDRVARDRVRERSAMFHAVSTALSAVNAAGFQHVAAPEQAEEAAILLKPGEESEQAKRVLMALLREMQAVCGRSGAIFLVTHCPATREAGGIEGWCREAGVPFVDVGAAFQDSSLSYNARTRERRYDSHYGRKGTRTFGAAFAPKLAAALNARKDPVPATRGDKRRP